MEFKIPLSAEELRLAADCASMVQNYVTLVSTDNGMDDELEKLLDQLESAIDPGGGGDNQWYRKDIRAAWKRIKGEAVWLDAPTCEGWWWFGEEVVEVYHDKRRNKLLVLYAGFDEQTEPKLGRWFGPLVPPSVVSGATSSGDGASR